MSGTAQILSADEDKLTRLHGLVQWTPDEVREELARILDSRFFIKSERLSCFLRTSVSYLLEGKGDQFKEYTVGTEVYKRPASYDPTQDSIVRTEARRLRSKLKEYYANSPTQSSIMIFLSAGSYIPVIQPRHAEQQTEGREAGSYVPLISRGEALCVGVFPFSARSTDSPDQALACNIEDEMTHELSQHSKIKVYRASSSINPDPMEHLRAWNRSGVQLILQGYVNPSSSGAIVQIQVTTISGMIVWSGRFDCQSLSDPYRDISTTVRAAILGSTALDQQDASLAPAFTI